jgi:hypothetical protein
MNDSALRSHLVSLIDWHDAHVDFDTAVDAIPEDKRGRVATGASHSLWQLVEHLRRAQHDILDFCRNPGYRELRWPDDYWPEDPDPPPGAWDDALAGYRADREAMQALARDPAIDLFAVIPHGSGQTYLREVLLVADHAAYHIGQIVLVRRMLGIWDA